MALVARGGSLAPGTSHNFRFDTLRINLHRDLKLNDAGQTAFRGVRGANNSGIWSEGGGSGLALVAHTGNTAPGTSGKFSHLFDHVLNNAGQTAFRGVLSGNNSGIWAGGSVGRFDAHRP